MNIFATSSCPITSAHALDDKRVNKMILESAQMLSTAMHVNGHQGPYRKAFANHPCTKWVSNNQENFAWLLDHLEHLAREWEYRRSKIHATARLIPIFDQAVELIPHGNREDERFVNATPFKFVNNVHLAYKLTLANKWCNIDKRTPQWTERGTPSWYHEVNSMLPDYLERLEALNG